MHKHDLSRFEGGAQGEHKLSRGFLPVITCSAHWMADTRLTSAIRGSLNKYSPFRNDTKND
ncbi:MAG TPA: hypothetical protein ENI67_04080 [Gammaproteobacteria bacterium]|nr:hypothetical protein [Gammaproteobacteria bacterium]